MGHSDGQNVDVIIQGNDRSTGLPITQTANTGTLNDEEKDSRTAQERRKQTAKKVYHKKVRTTRVVQFVEPSGTTSARMM